LPGPLAKHAAMELLSEDLANDFELLKEVLRKAQS
jgi:threonine synthase